MLFCYLLILQIKERWLSNRKDQLKPRKGEDVYDSTMKDTLSFRQFVNFLLYCPQEYEDCKVIMNILIDNCDT